MATTPDDLLSPQEEVDAIKRIATFYQNGTDLLQRAYVDIDPENIDRAKVEAEVNQILSDLENGTRRWIQESYPEMYIAAALVARQLIADEVKRTKRETGSRPDAATSNASKTDFIATEIDQQTIQTLSTTTFTHLTEALGGVRRKTSQILDDVTQKKIEYELAKLTEKPITLAEMKQAVTDIIKDAGVGSITDSSGKVWQLDTYAEMVTRTQHTSIVNSAMRNQALQSGFDLVIVSNHGADDSCGIFEGKIYSLTGGTKGYPNLFTASAGTHLFAPNCKHTYTPISQERAERMGPYAAGAATPYLDLRRFVDLKEGQSPSGAVQQQRNLIQLFPSLSSAQQKVIMELARQGNSPALKALEDLYKE